MAYLHLHHEHDKPIVWLRTAVRTPPFSTAARLEAGALLRRLQRGERIGMPHSRPMPTIGRRCHELRITDADRSWRIVYRLDPDAVVVVEIFQKSTQQTPRHILTHCMRTLRQYDRLCQEP